MIKRIIDFLFFCLFHKPYKDIKFAIKILKKNKLAKKNVKIEQRRKLLLSDCREIGGYDYGKGQRKKYKKRLCDIVKKSVSGRQKALFIQALAEFYDVKTVIEFGTSLGFSAMYLKNAESTPNVITIEGNTDIAEIAKENFLQTGLEIDLEVNRFENFIKKYNKTADMFFIDGNHSYDATLRYFDFALNHLSEKGIILFDDIRWSDGMLKSWKKIIEKTKTGIFVDIGSMGLFINSNEKKDIYCNFIFLQ